MTGHNVFDQMVTEITADAEGIQAQISQEDFEVWQKDVIWDALHGIRYGQSFCNRFGITNHLLYYTTWPPEQLNDYIQKHYIARS